MTKQASMTIKMKGIRFKPSILAYIVVLTFWALTIYAIVFMVPNIQGQIKPGRNLIGFILILSALVSPSLIITWSFFVEMTTSFSTDGINRLTPFGKRLISWREVKTLVKGIFFLEIRLSRNIYQIPLLMYKNPEELVNYVQEQFSEYTAKH